MTPEAPNTAEQQQAEEEALRQEEIWRRFRKGHDELQEIKREQAK